jgi:antitoxin CptB
MSDDNLKRMRMRAWRRGTREMDLILGPYADACLSGLQPAELALFEDLLDENDHDLYAWITARIGPEAQAPGPERFAAALERIALHAADRLRALP